jgi:predicted house-cleaning noncanonical NTP pyrophosphatase (MazG superfamily)
MTKNNKLVRDNIPDIIIKAGKSPIYHVIKEDKEYLNQLLIKLIEEANEVKDNPSKEELADVMEVVLAIAEYLKLDIKAVEEYRKLKSNKNGAFKKRYFLESVN